MDVFLMLNGSEIVAFVDAQERLMLDHAGCHWHSAEAGGEAGRRVYATSGSISARSVSPPASQTRG
jgi:hypothetical protein